MSPESGPEKRTDIPTGGAENAGGQPVADSTGAAHGAAGEVTNGTVDDQLGEAGKTGSGPSREETTEALDQDGSGQVVGDDAGDLRSREMRRVTAAVSNENVGTELPATSSSTGSHEDPIAPQTEDRAGQINSASLADERTRNVGRVSFVKADELPASSADNPDSETIKDAALQNGAANDAVERYAGEFDAIESRPQETARRSDPDAINDLKREMVTAQSQKLIRQLGRFTHRAPGKPLTAEEHLTLLSLEDMTKGIPEDKRLEDDTEIGRQADVTWRIGGTDMTVAAGTLSENIMGRVERVEGGMKSHIPIAGLNISLYEHTGRDVLEEGTSDWILNVTVNVCRDLDAYATVSVGTQYDPRFSSEVNTVMQALGFGTDSLPSSENRLVTRQIPQLEPERMAAINAFAERFLPNNKQPT